MNSRYRLRLLARQRIAGGPGTPLSKPARQRSGSRGRGGGRRWPKRTPSRSLGPGVGPIVAAGWLVATLTGAGVGAAAGSLLGSLTGAGVSEADAHVHAEGIRCGGTVVTVRAEETEGARIEAILDGRTAVDLATRRAEYETEGWSKNDTSAAPYTAEQVTTERKRRVVSVK